MSIPKGATHISEGHYYRKTLLDWFLYGSQGWVESACHPMWLEANAKPIHDPWELTRSAIIELAREKCGLDGDAIRQLATALVADGYRKFEIVDKKP